MAHFKRRHSNVKNKLILIFGLLFSMSGCRQDKVPNELKPKFDKILENPQILTEYDFKESTSISHIAIPFDHAVRDVPVGDCVGRASRT